MSRLIVVSGILLAFVVYRFNIFSFIFEQSSLPIHVDGFVKKGFERVKQAFRENYDSGLEMAGSSFSVYYKGELVVNLWGGYSNPIYEEQWVEKTLSISFSVTKGVVAICLALLVDRGLLNYDDLVSKYWPEFGHLKENVTVRMLLSHQAGLPVFERNIDFDLVTNNNEAFSKILESAKPIWPPGTKHGYHVLTFGWLADQLLRRVDPKHRSVGQFFRDEITVPFDIDYYIGLPIERLANVTYYTLRHPLVNFWNGITNSYHRWFILKLLDPTSLTFKSFYILGQGDLTLIGHQGIGGQMGVVDLSQKLSLAFLNNGLSLDVAGLDPRYIRLRDAVYKCIN